MAPGTGVMLTVGPEVYQQDLLLAVWNPGHSSTIWIIIPIMGS